MIIYFIIIGDILTSFAFELFNQREPSMLTNRTFYISIVAACLSIQIFKKEIHELKIASFLLFSSITIFVGIFAYQVLFSPA